MFGKLRNHLILALIAFTLTLAQQYTFFALKGFSIIWLSFVKYLVWFTYFFLVTFVRGPKTRYCLLAFILFFNMWQMGHMAFFGTQALPNGIWLFFNETSEVGGALKETLHFIALPLLLSFIPFTLLYFAQKKFRPTWTGNFLGALIICYFFYNPIRTYITGNTWGRQPSDRELTGMNLYLSLSYFAGKILPHKLSKTHVPEHSNNSMKLELKAGKKPHWDKVIIVLGESLTFRHMQLYGYKRPTTPFLLKKKNEKNFFHTIGLSGGVSTDISVAYFLNMGYGSSGAMKATKNEHCLFKLAKQKSYRTHFLSIQSQEQLRYITPYLCSTSMDDIRSLEHIAPNTPDHMAARDRDLIKPLGELLSKPDRQFIIVHQRGSHMPWNLRSTKDSQIFTGSPIAETDHYDNSVYEFDLFWKDLDHLLKQQKQKILVAYLSDHGESIGENGKWGHGFVQPTSFEIPIMITSYNKDLPDYTKKLPLYFTHYNLGLYLAKEIGYEPSQSPEVLPSDFEIYGNDIDGFAGKAKIIWGTNSYTFDYSL